MSPPHPADRVHQLCDTAEAPHPSEPLHRADGVWPWRSPLSPAGAPLASAPARRRSDRADAGWGQRGRIWPGSSSSYSAEEQEELLTLLHAHLWDTAAPYDDEWHRSL